MRLQISIQKRRSILALMSTLTTACPCALDSQKLDPGFSWSRIFDCLMMATGLAYPPATSNGCFGVIGAWYRLDDSPGNAAYLPVLQFVEIFLAVFARVASTSHTEGHCVQKFMCECACKNLMFPSTFEAVPAQALAGRHCRGPCLRMPESAAQEPVFLLSSHLSSPLQQCPQYFALRTQQQRSCH